MTVCCLSLAKRRWDLGPLVNGIRVILFRKEYVVTPFLAFCETRYGDLEESPIFWNDDDNWWINCSFCT